MKFYTVIFDIGGEIVSMIVQAANEKDAFFGALNQLQTLPELKDAPKVPAKCVAFFRGKCENVWLDLEAEMIRLGRNQGQVVEMDTALLVKTAPIPLPPDSDMN